MFIDKLPMVVRIAGARDKLIAQRDRGTIQLTIDGTNQSTELIDLCRPIIKRALNEQIAELDKDLRGLGVDVY